MIAASSADEPVSICKKAKRQILRLRDSDALAGDHVWLMTTCRDRDFAAAHQIDTVQVTVYADGLAQHGGTAS